MKLLVGVNTLVSVESSIYGNHSQFLMHLRKQIPDVPENVIATWMPKRMSIDMMRNNAVQIALDADFDYILFIDDDVLVPMNAFLVLEQGIREHGYDIMAGETFIRGYPYHIMAFREPIKEKNEHGLPYYDEYLDNTNEHGIIDCAAVGCSCMLISVPFLRKLTPPYFVTAPKHTEDIYLCLKAKHELGEGNLKIGMDPRVTTAHCLGPQYINRYNKHIYKLLEENEQNDLQLRADLQESQNSGQDPRGLSYIEACK